MVSILSGAGILFFETEHKKIFFKDISPENNISSSPGFIKRESQPYLTKQFNGSATVEASIILPIMFTVFLFFIWIIDLFRIHAEIGEIVNEVGISMVTYSYPYSKITDTDEIDNGNTFKDFFGEFYLRNQIRKSDAYKRVNGLTCILSNINLEKEVYLKVTYGVEPYLEVPFLNEVILTNVFYSKAYSDITRSVEEDIVYVFITKYSEVYHTNENCRSLKNIVSETTSASIISKRNKSGAKYYPCTKCVNEFANGAVYYTPYGTRYHMDSACPNLNTAVFKVPLSEVSDRRICYFCR